MKAGAPRRVALDRLLILRPASLGIVGLGSRKRSQCRRRAQSQTSSIAVDPLFLQPLQSGEVFRGVAAHVHAGCVGSRPAMHTSKAVGGCDWVRSVRVAIQTNRHAQSRLRSPCRCPEPEDPVPRRCMMPTPGCLEFRSTTPGIPLLEAAGDPVGEPVRQPLSWRPALQR